MSALLVFITCKDSEEGKKIANELVQGRLAACVNLSKVESIYRWKGKVERSGEYLLIVKTVEERFEELRKKVKEIHSYEVPEIVGIKIETGDKGYLDWLKESTSG
jgi:periplasmic divalent cation tolerance protein